MTDKVCAPLSQADFKTFEKNYINRETFGVRPGVWAFFIWAILTAVYIVAFFYIEQAKFDSEDETAKKISITEGITFYFITVLPLTILVYVYKMYTFAKLGYSQSFPDQGFHGGGFWAAVAFVVIGAAVAGACMIEYWQSHTLPWTLMITIVLLTLFVCILSGIMGEVVVRAYFTATKEYKEKFDCFKTQFQESHKIAIQNTEASRLKAFQQYKESQAALEALKPAESKTSLFSSKPKDTFLEDLKRSRGSVEASRAIEAASRKSSTAPITAPAAASSYVPYVPSTNSYLERLKQSSHSTTLPITAATATTTASSTTH